MAGEQLPVPFFDHRGLFIFMADILLCLPHHTTSYTSYLHSYESSQILAVHVSASRCSSVFMSVPVVLSRAPRPCVHRVLQRFYAPIFMSVDKSVMAFPASIEPLQAKNDTRWTFRGFSCRPLQYLYAAPSFASPWFKNLFLSSYPMFLGPPCPLVSVLWR